MNYCDFTFPTPGENLAFDEALLEQCEGGSLGEVLRFWEPANYFVVAGYANNVATEVNLPFCTRNSIPVLRRCTGGGTVLQGPGVLNYSLILRIDASGPLRSISTTNDFIMQRHQTALAQLLNAPVEMRGQTDLAIDGLKFCGNAQRRKKLFLIFHGAFLLQLDFQLLEQVLPFPSKQPDYRLNRSHSEFLMNLKVPAVRLKQALRETWGANETLAQLSYQQYEQVRTLVREKYSRPEWNLKF